MELTIKIIVGVALYIGFILVLGRFLGFNDREVKR
jgi:hypothetical protein